MFITYQPEKGSIRKNAKKYIKTSGKSFSFFTNLKFMLYQQIQGSKLKRKEINLLEDYIVVNNYREKEKIIRYEYIKEIIIDDEDIIIINEIEPVLVPKCAFKKEVERRQIFIDSLMSKYELVRIKYRSDIPRAYITENVNKSDYLYICDIEKENYAWLKAWGVAKLCSHKLNKIVLKTILFLGLTAVGIASAFKFMGAYPNIKPSTAGIVIAIILAIYIYFAFMHRFFMNVSHFKEKINEKKLRVKVEILGHKIFVDEGRDKYAYDVADILDMYIGSKGLVIQVKEVKSSRVFIMPLRPWIGKAKLLAFISIINTINNLPYENMGGDFKRPKKVLTIFPKVAVFLAIVSFPFTIWLVPQIFPNYYNEINNSKISLERQSALEVLNLINNVGNINQIGSNQGGSNVVNNNGSVTASHGLFQNLPDKAYYAGISSVQKQQVSKAVDAYKKGSSKIPSEYVYTKEKALPILQEYNLANYSPKLLYIVQAAQNAEQDIVLGTVKDASNQIKQIGMFLPFMSTPSMEGVAKDVFIQTIVDENMANNPSTANYIKTLNAEMPLNQTNKFVMDSIANPGQIGENIQPVVGPVEVADNGQLFRYVILKEYQGSKYQVYKLYESGEYTKDIEI
ncbi:MAG: hypothetical protein ACRCYE_10695 [Sarcina sp.]